MIRGRSRPASSQVVAHLVQHELHGDQPGDSAGLSNDNGRGRRPRPDCRAGRVTAGQVLGHRPGDHFPEVGPGRVETAQTAATAAFGAGGHELSAPMSWPPTLEVADAELARRATAGRPGVPAIRGRCAG